MHLSIEHKARNKTLKYAYKYINYEAITKLITLSALQKKKKN